MFFFKQKTAYELRISDWGSDLCSSDLNVADDRDATLLEIEQHDREGCCRHGCDWTCLGDEIGRTRLESGLDQERLEALSNPEQECRREDADDQGGEVRLPQIGDERSDQLRHGLTRSGDAEDRLELAGGNDNSRRGDETRHDRVGQEIGEKSELQHAHQQQENAGKQGEHEACGDKLRASWRGDAAGRSEEHTSELQSLMRISYAV